ncbi:MAG TPA: VOC family protein [Myxococcota bacterium]|nr:VOC family protein [Myxococcota bacterium]
MNKQSGLWPWFELIVPDVAKGVAFYEAVLGWKAATMSMGEFDYTMLGPVGSRQGCGVVPPQADGQAAQWTGYVMVPSVDEAAERALAAGGKLLAPAMDIPSVGRMAQIADPQGATVWLFKPETDEEMTTHYAPGFHWAELHTDDPVAAVAFYRQVLGMGHDTMDMGQEPYHMLVGATGPTCGIMRRQHAEGASMWLYWAAVDDADAALATAQAHHGQVLMPAFDVEGIGRMGILRDPQGAVLGVIKPAGA